MENFLKINCLFLFSYKKLKIFFFSKLIPLGHLLIYIYFLKRRGIGDVLVSIWTTEEVNVDI